MGALLQLHNQFEVSLVYLRPCLKSENKDKNKALTKIEKDKLHLQKKKKKNQCIPIYCNEEKLQGVVMQALRRQKQMIMSSKAAVRATQ